MNNRVLFTVVGIIFTALATYVIAHQSTRIRAKVTVQVFDEAGKPFPNADVQIGFDDPKTRLAVYSKGKTDAHGLFTAGGICNGSMGGSIKKAGYYDSGFPFEITGEKDGKWLPWNPICKTTLRPIGKPIALYAKTVRTKIPDKNKPCGYDLIIGDWVAPYGKGMEKDFVFTIQKTEVKDGQNFDAQGELTFSSPLDGLQPAPQPLVGKYSRFRWERQAPANGYNPSCRLYHTWWQSKHQKPIQNFDWDFAGSKKGWEGYFFRVRTREQDGKIVSAHFGKILGGIQLGSIETSTCTITFIYYLNPTPNDNNLEWDTKKNLFSSLSNDETPHPSWWP